MPEKEICLDGVVCGTRESHFYVVCECRSRDYARSKKGDEQLDKEINDELNFQANLGRRAFLEKNYIFYVNNTFMPNILFEKGALELRCNSCGNEFLLDYDLFNEVTGEYLPFLEKKNKVSRKEEVCI